MVMAYSSSSSSSSSCCCLLLLFLVLLFSFGRSEGVVVEGEGEAEQSSSSSLILPLTHSLASAIATTTRTRTRSSVFSGPVVHLIKLAASRSASRHRHRQKRMGKSSSSVSLPLSSGSDYLVSLRLHNQAVSLYMDTGSDLVWAPCHPFECILCEDKTPSKPPTPPLRNLSSFSSSTFVTCQSPACSAAHSSPSPSSSSSSPSPSSSSSSDLCAVANCPLDQIETSDCQNFSCPPFYYAYGDGSLVARLHRSTLHMGPSISLTNFTFGCSHTTLGEPVGVAGFGRGLLSFPDQLARVSPQLGNRFSYCLVSHSFDPERISRPSPLILGRRSINYRSSKSKSKYEVGEKIVYTPMLHNPKHPYLYSVSLEAVSVGPVRIPAPVQVSKVDPQGNGGAVVDSGTTYTMLPRGFYNAIVDELDRQMLGSRLYGRATEVEETTGLNPCYILKNQNQNQNQNRFNLPPFKIHFSRNATVSLPTRNYFYQFNNNSKKNIKKRRSLVACFTLMDGGDEEEEGPGATLGNYQQQGFEVIYDLENRRIGFARRKCDSMWDHLNRRR